MAARRAVINGAGKPLRFEAMEIPRPPPGFARIKLAYAGVCHSDIHIYHDTLVPVTGFKGIIGEERFNQIVMGHENAGYIDEFGPDVDDVGDLRKGDRVVVFPWLGCEECKPCCTGNTNLCSSEAAILTFIGVGPDRPGGFQTYITAKPCHLVKLPDTVPLDTGCLLACSGGTALSALQKLQDAVQYGSTVSDDGKARIMIIGAGGLGLWAVQLAKVMYAGKIHIVAADVDQAKLDFAKEFGVDETILWDRSATEEVNVAAATKNCKMNGMIDFVGSGMTSLTGFKCLASNGVLVLVGLLGGQLPLHTTEIVLQQKSVRGNVVLNIQQLKDVVKLVAENNIQYPCITHYPLDEVNTALHLLETGKIVGRAIIKHE